MGNTTGIEMERKTLCLSAYDPIVSLCPPVTVLVFSNTILTINFKYFVIVAYQVISVLLQFSEITLLPLSFIFLIPSFSSIWHESSL